MPPAHPAPPAPARPPGAVFDLGGVLIDWNPRYLYRQLFDDEAAMEAFLADVVSPEWNSRQDAGRPWGAAGADGRVLAPLAGNARRGDRADRRDRRRAPRGRRPAVRRDQLVRR